MEMQKAVKEREMKEKLLAEQVWKKNLIDLGWTSPQVDYTSPMAVCAL